LSSAEVVRRAIEEYRRKVAQGGFRSVATETAGKWKTLQGDSQKYVDKLRSEWETASLPGRLRLPAHCRIER